MTGKVVTFLAWLPLSLALNLVVSWVLLHGGAGVFLFTAIGGVIGSFLLIAFGIVGQRKV
jgi:hypothetical protein